MKTALPFSFWSSHRCVCLLLSNILGNVVLNSFALSLLPHPPLPLSPSTTKAQLSLGLVGSDGKNGIMEVVSREFQQRPVIFLLLFLGFLWFIGVCRFLLWSSVSYRSSVDFE